jgi:uncharacterized protein YcfL
MKYVLFLSLFLVACSSNKPILSSDPKLEVPNQELIVDPRVQSMGRNEVIDAIKQCETAGLRAIPIYAKRKIAGYSVETVVEVTCGPRYTF